MEFPILGPPSEPPEFAIRFFSAAGGSGPKNNLQKWFFLIFFDFFYNFLIFFHFLKNIFDFFDFLCIFYENYYKLPKTTKKFTEKY